MVKIAHIFRCIFFLSFIFTFGLFGITAQNSKQSLKKITGKVTNLDAALADVNIVIKNRNIGTKTNTKGAYVIQAKTGDQIQYSYVGFKTITIAVEDITSVLNINMITQPIELDETELTVKNYDGEVLKKAKKKAKIFSTSRGEINPERAGYSITYVDGSNITNGSGNLATALIGRVSPYYISNEHVYLRDRGHFAIWDIDGNIFDKPPPLDLTQIKDIYILKSLASTNRYGSAGKGGVIIVSTKYNTFGSENKKNDSTNEYTNKNYYNDDAVTFFDSNISTNNDSSLKEISGTVTNINKPLANVNITINNKNKNLKTNVQGNYNIKANIGDLIQFSYMGFKTVTIIVEDITSVLNIDMVTEVIKLDETVLATNNYEGKTLKNEKKKKRKFLSARGTINPDKAGYAVGYFDGTNISNIYNNLTDALVGRISGYYIKDGKPYLRGSDTPTLQYPAIWEVDGIVSTDEPYVDLSQIKDIRVLKSLAATNRYGSAGVGGVIVVTTKYGSFSNTKNKKQNTADKYTNKNLYNDDAVSLDINSNYNNEDIDSLIAIKIKSKAFKYYQNSLKHTIKDYNVQITLAKAFKNYYKDLNLVSQILMDIAYAHNKNPEILKAVAFQMQAYGLKNEAINVYERIFKLRPHYAQSYRDLANAYKDNEQFNKSWKLYMSYLLQGNDVKNEGIGNILYSEMEWLYFNEKNQALKNIQFVPKSKSIKDFKNDVRLVFEWNTSEAEFDLEFVNPNKQVYNFEHSLVKDPQLISDEKKKGYSSKEFIIDNLNNGKWLVNITYLGNKKPEPTYIKVTVYNHWGNPNQQEKI